MTGQDLMTRVVYRGERADLQGQSFDVPAAEANKAGYIERQEDDRRAAQEVRRQRAERQAEQARQDRVAAEAARADARAAEAARLAALERTAAEQREELSELRGQVGTLDVKEAAEVQSRVSTSIRDVNELLDRNRELEQRNAELEANSEAYLNEIDALKEQTIAVLRNYNETINGLQESHRKALEEYASRGVAAEQRAIAANERINANWELVAAAKDITNSVEGIAQQAAERVTGDRLDAMDQLLVAGLNFNLKASDTDHPQAVQALNALGTDPRADVVLTAAEWEEVRRRGVASIDTMARAEAATNKAAEVGERTAEAMKGTLGSLRGRGGTNGWESVGPAIAS